MQSYLSLAGKVFLGLLVVVLVITGIVLLVRRVTPNIQKLATTKVTPTPTKTVTKPSFPTSNTPSQAEVQIPSMTQQSKQAVKAGKGTYGTFTTSFPQDWAVVKDGSSQAGDRVVFTKQGYALYVDQTSQDNFQCGYPDVPTGYMPAYKEVRSVDGSIYRRSKNVGLWEGKQVFTLCARNNDGTFRVPTQYGVISYAVPAAYNELILSEMDTIISNLHR